MKVGTARLAAAEWVERVAGRQTWFAGAYYSGSTVLLSDETELAPASDLDLMIVTSQAEPSAKLGKLVYRGALLEVTYIALSQLASAEEVLSSYHLAGSFRTDTIIADPTGRLRQLQSEVSRHFAERKWVLSRCGNARQKIEDGLRAIDLSAPLHDRVTAWLFPTGVTAHVLLAAALRNPTVRLRYLAARGVLQDYGCGEPYPRMLELLGCDRLTPQHVGRHLDALARTFDAAATAARTPFFFSSDITAAARPIAIDGSRELIRSGNHREAVFWIAATFARCHKILAADAPALERELAPAFQALIDDLGIGSTDRLMRRAEDVLQFLPELWSTAERIISPNPGIDAD